MARTSRRRRRVKKKKTGFRWFRWLLLLGLIFGVFFYAKVQMHWEKPNSDDPTRVSLTIPLGTSVSGISDLLEDKGVIKDAKMFELYARQKALAPKLQAGDYVIQKDQTYAQISEILSHGKSEEVKITIPEGYTLSQIDELFAGKGLTEQGDIIKLNFDEGFVYPDTYFVMGGNFNAQDFLNRGKSTLEGKIKPYTQAIEESGRTLNDIVIMASMIEREAFGKAEMNMISGILWKRIDIGEPLGVDATTRYEKNNWKDPLYTADFAEKTPYNTRKVAGLPPTAIGSPGIDALKAAVFPKESDYLFYLHDPSGKIHYAATNREHEVNKSNHLK